MWSARGSFACVIVACVIAAGCERKKYSCSEQQPPHAELYPRLTCQAARDELDRVARGEAPARAIVLRGSAMILDAKDVTGPAHLTCDTIGFDVVDAQQADPSGPIVMSAGPTSILVTELATGTVRVSQYCVCCNIVGKERR